VRAVNQLGAGLWSGSLGVAGEAQDLPSAPSGLELVKDPAAEDCILVGQTWRCFVQLRWLAPFSGGDQVSFYQIEYTAVQARRQLSEVYSEVVFPTSCGNSSQLICYTISLPPGSAFSMTVRSVNSVGVSIPSFAFQVSTPASRPNQVVNKDVTNVTQTSLDVRWVEPASNGQPITMYQIWTCDVRSLECKLLQLTGSPPVTTVTVGSLASGRNYTVTVESFNLLGSSGNATSSDFYTTFDVPLKPAQPFLAPALAGLPLTTTQHIMWTPPFDNGDPIVGYQLLVDGSTLHYVEAPRDSASCAEQLPQFLVIELIPGTQHSYRVRAVNSFGTSEESDSLISRTQDDVPGKPAPPVPSFVNVNAVDAVELRLQDAPYVGAFNLTILYYQLEERLRASDSVQTSLFNVSVDAMTVRRPRENTQDYEYRARAVSALGPGIWSDLVYLPNDFSALPSQPVNVSVLTSTVADTAFDVSWILPRIEKNVNASFRIRLSPVADSEGNSTTAPPVIQTIANSLAGCADAGLYVVCNYRVSGARPYTQYQVQVSAESDSGVSLPSEISAATIVTTPSGPPVSPVDFKTIGAATTSLTLSWRVPPANGERIFGYILSFGESSIGLSANTALVGPASDCSALSRAQDGRSESSQGPSEGSLQIYTLESLRSGTSFSINITACNAKGPSPDLRCVCAEPLCRAECSSLPVPAHTHAVPDKPIAPTQLADLSLETLKIRSLFITWEFPYSHELPILSTELSAGNSTFTFFDGEAGYNISQLTPATQYPVRVRFRNRLGPSEWSGISWLSTKPDAPATPDTTNCDPLRASESQFFVQLGETDDNGVPIDLYELRMWVGSSPEFSTDSVMPVAQPTFQATFASEKLGFDVTAEKLEAYNSSITLLEDQEYLVLVRARNVIGWGPWSAPARDCATTPPPTPPFPMLILILVLCAVVALLILCMFIWWKTDLPKVLAPRLRKKQANMDPFEDFVGKDDNPMEDHDPDLVMNPIMLAKLQIEKESKMKKSGRKSGTDSGKSGGLKRLGIKFDEATPESSKSQKFHMKQIDLHLRKEEEQRSTATKDLGASASGAGTSTEVSEASGKGWRLSGMQRGSQRESIREKGDNATKDKCQPSWNPGTMSKMFKLTGKDRKGASTDEIASVLSPEHVELSTGTSQP